MIYEKLCNHFPQYLHSWYLFPTVFIMAAEVKEENESSKRVIYTYPMVKQTDMPDDIRAEVMEMCVNACEKHTTNNENAAKMIKEALDKKYGTSWHVVVGEGFGFEISYELKNLMYMFFAGNVAVCAWKCS